MLKEGIVWKIEIPRKTKQLYSVLYHITVHTQAKIELTKIHRHICWFTKLLVEVSVTGSFGEKRNKKISV